MIELILIDDDEFIRTSLRLLLREADFVVTGEAKTGEDGLAQVERLQPDVVCLDIQMPGMDGLATLQQLKANWPDIAVLMITSSSTRESVDRAMALGADGYIVKPFNADRIIKSIEAAHRKCKSASA